MARSSAAAPTPIPRPTTSVRVRPLLLPDPLLLVEVTGTAVAVVPSVPERGVGLPLEVPLEMPKRVARAVLPAVGPVVDRISTGEGVVLLSKSLREAVGVDVGAKVFDANLKGWGEVTGDGVATSLGSVPEIVTIRGGVVREERGVNKCFLSCHSSPRFFHSNKVCLCR